MAIAGMGKWPLCFKNVAVFQKSTVLTFELLVKRRGKTNRFSDNNFD